MLLVTFVNVKCQHPLQGVEHYLLVVLGEGCQIYSQSLLHCPHSSLKVGEKCVIRPFVHLYEERNLTFEWCL